ncbi:MAG: translation initiation factor IF-2 [Armatimonadota bacterium]
MAGITVKDLAVECKLNDKEMLSNLVELGIDVSSGTDTIDFSTALTMRDMLVSNVPVAEATSIMALRDLAQVFGVQPPLLQQQLMKAGLLVGLTQSLNKDQIEELAFHFKRSIKWLESTKVVVPKTARPTKKGSGHALTPRPPVVTILGHVDHGKTTLLDAIRHTNVVDSEAGGITQHIGAYQVEIQHKGEPHKITFLDTPGHEAFTAMRARGAQITDIAILIVAADDGVMPQTVEAINHAKAAGVPIIVAVNKIDKENANPDRLKQQLAELNLVTEEWGGDVMFVPISAKKRTGIENILEAILLQAEMLELMADAHAEPEAIVVESKIERGRGSVTSVIITSGTLKVGDCVVSGSAYGRVRAITDEKGKTLTKAVPAQPVEITGLSKAPEAGDRLEVVKNERTARQLAQRNEQQERVTSIGSTAKTQITIKDLHQQIAEGKVHELHVIVKADVAGSAEAIQQQLARLEHSEVRVRVLSSAVGNVNEGDVNLASASNALILGFNVKIEPAALQLAEVASVEIRVYSIIYELQEEIEAAMRGLLEPRIEENTLGKAEIRTVFNLPRGTVAGSYVTDGKIARGQLARLWRGTEQIWEGPIDSLRHIKDDVREMAAGYECGIVFQNFTAIEEGDIVECFERKEVARADVIKLRQNKMAQQLAESVEEIQA